MTWDDEVDCAGLLCPLPVLKAQRRLRGMRAGQVLALVATDAMAAVDVPMMCAEAGHTYLGSMSVVGAAVEGAPAAGEATRYLIRKG